MPDGTRTKTRARRELWLWLVPVLLAIALLALASGNDAWAPPGWAAEPLLLLLALAAALAGALHRPFGGASLALGALIVYPGFARFGIVPVAGLVATALVGAELSQRFIEARRDLPLPERRSLSRLAGWVAIAVLSVLAAGAIFLALPDRWALAVTLSSLAWLAIPLAYELAIRRSVRRESLLDLARAQLPLLFDLAGLALGALVVVLAGEASWALAWVVLAAFALLAGEAARNGLAASGHVRQLDEAHRLRRAGLALAAGGSGSGGIVGVVEQVREECASLLPFSWFQLELEVPDQGRASWWAEAGGALAAGEPSPRHLEDRRARVGRPAADRLGAALVRSSAHRSAGPRAVQRPLAADGGVAARSARRARGQSRPPDRGRLAPGPRAAARGGVQSEPRGGDVARHRPVRPRPFQAHQRYLRPSDR